MSVEAARWQAIKAAFDEAAEGTPEAREALLAHWRQADPALHAEVISLLAADAPAREALTPLLPNVLAHVATESRRGSAGGSPTTSTAAGFLAEGTHLGPYVLGPLLGAGGMGYVYRARDSRLEREVALKVMRHEESNFLRFEREAKAVAALSHPNIVAIHDFGEADGRPYMVSELLVGRTLREALGQGPVPARRVVEYALQLAYGLAAAHDKGIIHRDLKPENVFITHDERVKLLDFGIAHASEPAAGAEALTGAGVVIGTVGYMSPEQLVGEPVTAASDVFSLGAILYEMIAGERAFGGRSAPANLRSILSTEPPPLPTGTGLPPGIGSIVRRCLEKRPEARFQSARDVAFAIEAIASDSRSSQAAPVARRPFPRRAAALVGLAVGLLVAAGYVGRLTASRDGETGASHAPSVVTLRTLTYSGRDLSPAASPDGRLIAFRSDRDGQGRIWLRQTASGEERALTAGPDDFPRFAPDGASLLFTRTVGAQAALYRVPTLGGEPRRVREDASDADHSPDGKRIAFIRWGNEPTQARPRLYVADVDGSAEHLVATLENRVRACPRFSPDGARIAVTGFAQQPGAPASIFLVDSDGQRPERLAAPGSVGFVSCVTWLSPHELAYAQAESVTGNSAGSPARVYAHDLRGGGARQLFASPSTSLTLDVLGEGSLLFDARAAQQNLLERGMRDGSESRWLTRGLGTNRQPVYSPDGEWVVFSSNQSGNLDLWALSTSSGAVRRITDHPAEDWDPAFTPDGQLLWSSNRTGHFEIWRAGADGSAPQQVTTDGVDAENPSATPDGWVVYASGAPDRQGIWKVRQDGTGAARLVPGAILPEASPDGRHVVYQSNRSPRVVELGVARLADGVQVFHTTLDVVLPTPAVLGRARWLPGGHRLAFVGQDERGRNGVFTQDFTPGEDTRSSRRPVAGFDAEDVTESFGLSADGSRIVLARWTQSLSLMIATGLRGVARAPAR